MPIRSYFDVDEILCGEERVPVSFQTPVFHLAHDVVVRSIDGEKQPEVKLGSRAVLPVWAAAALRRSGFLQVPNIPKEYSNMVFREFKVDPMAPNLRAKSPYYFEHGLHISSMLPTHEGIRLRHQLHRLYQVRFLGILNSTAKRGHDFHDVRDTLTESEKTVLDSTMDSLLSERRWLRSSSA
jgi:hypothetical protein